MLAVSKNLHNRTRRFETRTNTAVTKKAATLTTDLGKVDGAPPGGKEATSVMSETRRRMTFDEQAVRSFAENPGLYRKKIGEHKKAAFDDVTTKMGAIDNRFLGAALARHERTVERLQDARKLLGDPQKVMDVKAALDQRARYNSLCSYVESSQKARKYMRRQAKMAVDDANDRE